MSPSSLGVAVIGAGMAGRAHIAGVIAQNLRTHVRVTGEGGSAGIDGFLAVELFRPFKASDGRHGFQPQARSASETALDVDEHVDPFL